MNKVIIKGCLSIAIVIGLSIATGCSSYQAPQKYLYMKGDGKDVTCKVATGDVLLLTYQHSLYHVEQTEVFEVQDDKNLLLRKMIFGSLNALYYYDEQAQNYYQQDGSIHLIGIDKKFSKIPFRMSYSKSHVLTIMSPAGVVNRINVSEHFRPGAYVEMGIIQK